MRAPIESPLNPQTPATITRFAAPAFGRLLRQWRLSRRLSQLTLALDADISARHVSFLETGRARPSREMVLGLAHALDVPLRERNSLLLAAGYAPVYAERPLTAPELEPVQRALQFMLKQQEPYPALVIDGSWNIKMANEGAGRVFAAFLEPSGLGPEHANNAMHAVFHPNGMRRYIENWEELSGDLIQRLHREAAAGVDARSAELLKELLAYPGVPARWQTPELSTVIPPLVPVRLRKDGLALRFFTTITTLGTPQDVTLQQLRIECFFPEDRATEALVHGMAQPSPTVVRAHDVPGPHSVPGLHTGT